MGACRSRWSQGGASNPVLKGVIVDHTTGILTTCDNSRGVYQLRFNETMSAPHAPAWAPKTA